MADTMDRRTFLGVSLGTGAAFALGGGLLPGAAGAIGSGRGAGKKMLILGGTRFLGPQIVRAARALDYEVTLFNRGKSGPDMFPDLETLRGDRDKGELGALKGRKWNVVVDTCGYVPGHVRAAAEMLKDSVDFYVFVSTVSVYADPAAKNVDEGAPVQSVNKDVLAKVKTIRASYRWYGGMKAHCEQAAESVMPGRVCTIRPGLIVGPRDGSDRFTYWPVRVHRGGEILALGNPHGEVQFIDVRDLGEWAARMANDRKAGAYNAVGFQGRLGMGELLHGCKVVLNTDCRFTWVSEKFLLKHKVRPYLEMPLWLPAGARGHFDNRRATAAGLTFRPVGNTIQATLEWHRNERGDKHRWRYGMRRDREATLLEAWKKEGAREN